MREHTRRSDNARREIVSTAAADEAVGAVRAEHVVALQVPLAVCTSRRSRETSTCVTRSAGISRPAAIAVEQARSNCARLTTAASSGR